MTSQQDTISGGGLIDGGDQGEDVASGIYAGHVASQDDLPTEMQGALENSLSLETDASDDAVSNIRARYGADVTEKASVLLYKLSEGRLMINSWKAAGFTSLAEALRALDSPSVRVNAAHFRDNWIRTIGGAKAVHRLNKLMDDGVSASVQFSAAKMVLELAGHTKGGDAGEKPQAEMTEAELQDFIDRMERQIANGKAPVIKIKP